MKKLIIVLLSAVLITTYSCSSTRDTERADPKAGLNKPMRHADQADTKATAGHQNDEVRENNR